MVSPLRFDPATARDLLDALRYFEGRLLVSGRRLSDGALEIRRLCERSLRVTGDQPAAPACGPAEDDRVLALLDYQDVADRMHVSVSTVKRRVRSGELPAVRIGPNVRVRPADLAAYIADLPAAQPD